MPQWRKYLPQYGEPPVAGFQETGPCQFTVHTHCGARICRSMMRELELLYLYSLARDAFHDIGQIVDLGPYTGMSTFALASGVLASHPQPNARIWSYDLFLSYDWFASEEFSERTGSVFPQFQSTLNDFSALIMPCPGDALSLRWLKQPVEILFVDLAKSWELNAWVLSQFFPCLVPGRSWVVQQDFIHFNEYWVQITMEYFADRFEFDEAVFGASAGFRSVATISESEARVSLEELPLSRKMALLESARMRMPPSVRPVMECAMAKCLLDCGEIRLAEDLIRDIDTRQLATDPALDFHEIAMSNQRAVAGLIAACRQT